MSNSIEMKEISRAKLLEHLNSLIHLEVKFRKKLNPREFNYDSYMQASITREGVY